MTVDNVRDVLAEGGASVSDEDLQAVIDNMDADGDGRVSFEEFLEHLDDKL